MRETEPLPFCDTLLTIAPSLSEFGEEKLSHKPYVFRTITSKKYSLTPTRRATLVGRFFTALETARDDFIQPRDELPWRIRVLGFIDMSKSTIVELVVDRTSTVDIPTH